MTKRINTSGPSDAHNVSGPSTAPGVSSLAALVNDAIARALSEHSDANGAPLPTTQSYIGGLLGESESSWSRHVRGSVPPTLTTVGRWLRTYNQHAQVLGLGVLAISLYSVGDDGTVAAARVSIAPWGR